MLHQEFHFVGGDGLGLYAQAWLPGTEDGQSQAVVVWVHGFLEHSGRYAATAETLRGGGTACTRWTCAGTAAPTARGVS